MSRLFIELYFDEDVSVLVAGLLRARGFSVQTTQEAGRIGASDREQLSYSVSRRRALLTHNRDEFARLTQEYFTGGRAHYGVIIAVRRPPHEIVRRLLTILRPPPTNLKIKWSTSELKGTALESRAPSLFNFGAQSLYNASPAVRLRTRRLEGLIPMLKTLQCPSCGAPLEYDPASESDTIRCPFCASTAVLPPRSRQQEVKISFGRPQLRSKGSPAVGLAVLGVVLVVSAGIVIFIVVAINRATSQATRAFDAPNTRSTLNPPHPPTTRPAEPQPFFGSEGIGPGNFKDARSIAVDAEGRIYVGEYTGGRIQVFDSSGKFVTQWTVDPKMPLRGMTADRRGTVYIVQKGEIMRYEGATGKQLGTTGVGGGRYDDVTATPDGGLVAFSYQARDDVVKLDPSGLVKQVIRAAVSGQTERSELSIRVAADGVGNVYALGEFNDAVFKFSPDGRYLTRFGGDGDEPGLFRAPSAIAVDNQGRVYVADFKGVQVFDANGRYVDLIKVKGAASGLAFNDKGELFVVARTAVYKFPTDKR